MNVFEGETFRIDKMTEFINYYVNHLHSLVKVPFKQLKEATRIVMHQTTEYAIVGQLGSFFTFEVNKDGVHKFYGIKIINDNTLPFGEVQIFFNPDG